ncbi:hypothetical protein LSTR_LSTR007917 [Laodelphax striatellus]|uniref:Protein NATD1 n=1 Tax=Laodelphax striatellus TaxID=195883 RepID=A0A482XL42_LAOST|nr:hypothetical protein LSTR_LSTR007917 [Laodelphax striatellus]
MSRVSGIARQYFRNIIVQSGLADASKFEPMSSEIKEIGYLINDHLTNTFMLPINNEFAAILYNKHEDGEGTTDEKTLVLSHTEVPEIYQGKGVGKLFAKEVFDYCAKNDLKLILTCEFLQECMKKNPQYQNLLADK